MSKRIARRYPDMKMILTAITAFLLLAFSAFAKTEDCLIYETRNWHAWIDQGGENGGTRLIVAGQLDLPTPGFEIAWEQGPLDRMQPPALRLRLRATPPDGMVLQAITPTDVMHKQPYDLLEYRAVIVLCGEHVLAEIFDVKPTD